MSLTVGSIARLNDHNGTVPVTIAGVREVTTASHSRTVALVRLRGPHGLYSAGEIVPVPMTTLVPVTLAPVATFLAEAAEFFADNG
jgi:hypothetical protein